MRSPNGGAGGAGGEPTKPVLPIDIHLNKLLDWLIDRRHCNVNWAADAVVVRGKINSALSLPLEEIPVSERLSALLAVPHPNFFHVREIIDVVSVTEKEKKNFLGQCTSPVLNAWTEVAHKYRQNGVFLAEAAQQLIRFVNYEITALKKAVDKNGKMVKECERKEAEYDQQVNQIADAYKNKCRRLGIEGVNVRRELVQQLEDLPRLYADIAEDCRSLDQVLAFYRAFLAFLRVKEDDDFLPVLRHILTKGNTTVFEYRTGLVPSRAVAPEVGEGEGEDGEAEAAEEDIDWGDLDLDGGDDGSSSFAPIEINWESAPTDVNGVDGSGVEAEIDWGGVVEGGVVEGGVDASVDFEVVGDADVLTAMDRGEVVAVGKEALTLLENPSTRSLFYDELMECESFLCQRLTEIRRDDDVLSVNQFQNADLILQNADEKKVESMLSSVRKVVAGIQGEKVVQLGLIKANPRSLSRLVEGVTQYSLLGDRMRRNRDHVALRRQEAEEENQRIRPQIDALRKKTKLLQKNLEDEISRKYDDRPVNIMGEINLI